MVPCYKRVSFVVTGFACATLVHFYSKLNVIYILAVGFALFTAPLCLLAPATLIMSSVYKNSMVFKQHMMDRVAEMRNSVDASHNRKILTSQQSLRCQIGNFYTMESEAKLTTADTVIQTIVFILLLLK